MVNIALAIAGGAAKQFTDDQAEMRKEYRDKKDRQKAWADKNGKKILDDLEAKSDFVLNAGESLEAYGLETKNVQYIVDTYGTNALLELKKQVDTLSISELEALKVSKGLNSVIKGIPLSYEPSDTSWAEGIVKDFKIQQLPNADPSANSGGFFADLLSGKSMRDEHDRWMDEDFLKDSSGQGISIRELRAAPSGRPERGTVAKLDLTALSGSGTSSAFNTTKKLILDAATIAIETNGTAEQKEAFKTSYEADVLDPTGTNSTEKLLALRTNDLLIPIFEQATRDVYNTGNLATSFNSPFAHSFYGTEDALNAILNPLTLEQELDELNLTGDNRPKEFNTQEEAKVYWRKNLNVEYAIIDGQFAKRTDRKEDRIPAPGDVVPGDVAPGAVAPRAFDTSDLTLNVQPTESVEGIPARPEEKYYDDSPKIFEKPQNYRKIRTWDKKYGDKYNYDGTYKIVRPLGAKPPVSAEYELALYGRWLANYDGTHDEITGYPLVDNINLSLIPGTPEFEEAKKQKVAE